jgi:hypothetical protein
LQQFCERSGNDALAECGGHAARNENVFSHFGGQCSTDFG